MTDFLTGNLTDHESGISWEGKHGNQTYQELEDMLFKKTYTSFTTPNKILDDNFILTHGFCKKVGESNLTGKYEFKTKEKSRLLIIDPNRVCKLRISEMDSSPIVMGPTDENLGYFSYEYFELDYTLHDKSIHDGTSCLNYERLGSSYGECVNNKLKDISLKSYGCLPQWFHQEGIFLILNQIFSKSQKINILNNCL